MEAGEPPLRLHLPFIPEPTYRLKEPTGYFQTYMPVPPGQKVYPNDDGTGRSTLLDVDSNDFRSQEATPRQPLTSYRVPIVSQEGTKGKDGSLSVRTASSQRDGSSSKQSWKRETEFSRFVYIGRHSF